MITFELNKIIIKNFACFEDENVIDLSSNSSGNIFLFNILNGHGKTSLFHAIKWGFFGEAIKYFKDADEVNPKDFLYDQLPKEEQYMVKIFFRCGDDEYVLERTRSPRDKFSKLKLNKNGRTVDDYAVDEIFRVFPVNLADFFMFDGEQLSRFTIAQREINYKDSIYQLLGLKPIRSLKDDLKKLEKRYERELQELKSSNKEVNKLKKVVDSLNSEIENNNILIKKHKITISKNQEFIDRYKEEFKKFGKLPEIHERLKVLWDRNTKNIKEQQGIRERLKLNSQYFFVRFIKSDLETIIEQNRDNIEKLREISGLSEIQAKTQAAKEEILKKSIPICDVCGHELTPEESKKIKNEQEGLTKNLEVFRKNKLKSDDLLTENSLLNLCLDKLKGMDFQKELDRYCELDGQIDADKKEIEALQKEAGRGDFGDPDRIIRNISSLQKDNGELEQKIKGLDELNKGFKNKKDDKIKEIKKRGHGEKGTERISGKISRLTNLQDHLEEALEASTNDKRNKILKKSNELFLSITNKPEEYEGLQFESEDSFAFTIKYNDGTTAVNPSKGEKMVMALSFLLGLNQYTGRNNSIVMDTPVATLDEIHAAGIGTALSKLDNQVLFFAQPMELKGEISERLEPAITKRFKVEREFKVSKIMEVSE